MQAHTDLQLQFQRSGAIFWPLQTTGLHACVSAHMQVKHLYTSNKIRSQKLVPIFTAHYHSRDLSRHALDSSLPTVQCLYGSQDDSKRNCETTQIKVSARIPGLHRNLTERQKTSCADRQERTIQSGNALWSQFEQTVTIWQV